MEFKKHEIQTFVNRIMVCKQWEFYLVHCSFKRNTQNSGYQDAQIQKDYNDHMENNY